MKINLSKPKSDVSGVSRRTASLTRPKTAALSGLAERKAAAAAQSQARLTNKLLTRIERQAEALSDNADRLLKRVL